jgi:hypothetical protein
MKFRFSHFQKMACTKPENGLLFEVLPLEHLSRSHTTPNNGLLLGGLSTLAGHFLDTLIYIPPLRCFQGATSWA